MITDTWTAFCTIAWFITGIRYRMDDNTLLGNQLYWWWFLSQKADSNDQND